MATTLARIIRYGLLSIRRNGLLSVATVLVLLIALLTFEGLILFGAVTDQAISVLKDKIDISVYFKSTASEDDIAALQKSLEQLPEVATVEYTSREQALEAFKERNKDNPTITIALAELADNPLPASLTVKAHDPAQYEKIANYLADAGVDELVDKVTYLQSREAIERLADIIDTVKRLGLFITLFLALTAALITFNTVRLAMYSNREEIGIMRLVGASNVFINGPYLVSAVIFGAVAALGGLIISWPFIALATPYLAAVIPEMDLTSYFWSHLPGLLAYQLLFGIGLAVISGAVAIRRYLKT